MYDEDKLLLRLYEWYAETKIPPYAPMGSAHAKFVQRSITRFAIGNLIDKIKQNKGRKPLIEVLTEYQITMDQYSLEGSKTASLYASICKDVADYAIDIYYTPY